nr:NAD(P)H-binding protein [Snodgrassella gandavensis]
MAKNIVQAMHQQQLKRLIWISSMGIYSETATETDSILAPYRQSAKIIEDSDLNYTIIRPAWFTHDTEINYQLTHKGEAFQGQQVSRHSIADLINKLIQNPEYAVRESLGIAKV